jgi:hypothetical protein
MYMTLPFSAQLLNVFVLEQLKPNVEYMIIVAKQRLLESSLDISKSCNAVMLMLVNIVFDVHYQFLY